MNIVYRCLWFNAISRYTKYKHVDNSVLNIYESPLSIHIQFKRSALLWASEKGHVEVLKCLLEKDASNINEKDYVRYISSIQSFPFDYSLYFLCVI